MIYKNKKPVCCRSCGEKFIREYQDEEMTKPSNFHNNGSVYYHLKCYKKREEEKEKIKREQNKKKEEKEKIKRTRLKILDTIEKNATRTLNSSDYSRFNQTINYLLKQNRKINGIYGTLIFLLETNEKFNSEMFSIGWINNSYQKAEQYFKERQKIKKQQIQYKKSKTQTIIIPKITKNKKEKWSLD